ncbi:MAG: DUF1848 domain-containing protein [Candidatus Tectomicrobia bacterium]|uniref:DUF1848 domain-containing protein n=1 Tax=Tectimicrobiota bacterium TaxID=2528274 RepID=A0A932CLQ1_UNCTE|nr:DUF1848 domain-containing protein [Candidatus Tectomicrobia bacterium]
MIISASRRTDIPAFYTEWLMNRIRAGYCTVPSPFNRNQISTISLKPEDVVIVFWTRHPRPLLPHLTELDERGYRYYFQYTVMENPRLIDPQTPPREASLETFRRLADRIGADRVIWRYDPILFSTITDAGFHQRTYEKIAQGLRGYTSRSVISIVDPYRKTERRLRELAGQGIAWLTCEGEALEALIRGLARIAAEQGMKIVSCAEKIDLRPYGVQPGKCVDDQLIAKAFGIEVPGEKDPVQREACGCVASKDIGMYDSCLFGCQYCYATTSFERARTNHQAHDPGSPSLLGWYEAKPGSKPHSSPLSD